MRTAVSRLGFALLVTALAACATLAGVGGPDDLPAGDGSVRPTGTTPADSVVDENLDINRQPNEVIDLGGANCGVSTREERIVLHNKTDKPKAYMLVAPNAPFVIVDPSNGQLGPFGTTTITVSAKPTEAGDQMGNLVITSEKAFVPITLKTSGIGATLVWSPDTTDLGSVQQTAGSATTITLTNKGTGSATVDSFSVSNNQYSISPGSATLVANASQDFTVTLKGGDASKQESMITPTTSSVMCATPTPLSIKGNRVDVKVTVSGVDWGKKDCTTSPDAKTITITNYSPLNGLRWTFPTAPAPTKFSVVTGATGTLGPAPDATDLSPTKGTITVKPNALPATVGAYDETIQIAIQLTNPGNGMDTNDLPVNYPSTLHVDVRGAILAFNPTTLAFVAAEGSSQKKSFTVTNTGNENGYVDFDFNRTAGGPAWIPPDPLFSFAGFGAESVDVRYQPTSQSLAPPHTATLTPRMNGPKVCNALPVINLSGAPP